MFLSNFFCDFLRFFEIFQFLNPLKKLLLGFVHPFLEFFVDCFVFLHLFLFFFYLLFLIFLFFFWIFWMFSEIFGFFFKWFSGFHSQLLRLLLKVTKVTTGHHKLPKMGQNSIIKKVSAEGQSPPQELEVGPHSRPYLLVCYDEAFVKKQSIIVKYWVLFLLTLYLSRYLPIF